MGDKRVEVSKSIKEAYFKQYDQNITEWRKLAARSKAENIVELSKSIAFKSVLEVGSGEGSILYWLSKWNFSDDLNALEISESGINVILERQIPNLSKALLFDGYNIPFEDKHFDLVICSHVMEHVEYERILLREIERVSKYQIFEVPIDFSFYVDRKVKHFMSYGHINIYTPSLFRFLLLSENFKVLGDKCVFYEKEIIKHTSKSKFHYRIIKLKGWILKNVSYLKGIKPSSYAVLTTGSEEKLSIF